MQNRIIYLVMGTVLTIAAYFFIMRTPEGKAGKLAPKFEAELINGEGFNLTDLRGQYVILDFWGSWCGPCIKDNPNLVKLNNEFSDAEFQDADGFKIVTVALEKKGERWKKVAERQGFNWEHQIVQYSRAVLLSPIAQKYAVSEIPAKFLISPKGEIIGVNQKYDELKAFLTARLKN